jgi:hypothetical protein
MSKYRWELQDLEPRKIGIWRLEVIPRSSEGDCAHGLSDLALDHW